MISLCTRSTLAILFCALAIPALVSAAWADGAPRTSKSEVTTSTIEEARPSSLVPLPVQMNQVIDDLSKHPAWLVMLKARPSGSNAAGSAIDDSINSVLADAEIGASRVSYRYRHAIVGFCADLTPREAARLAADPRVKHVDPARRGEISLSKNQAGGEASASWEHRRISNPEGDASSLDRCGFSGAGVTIIIVDTGINANHSEVEGRVNWSLNFTDDGAIDGSDVDGHGTSVASIAAGATIGVAPEASIASLRVGDGLAITDPPVIAALDWIVGHADELAPAVVNMSLKSWLVGDVGGVYQASLAAVESQGFPIFAAAGNESVPASWVNPAASVFATTVGASTGADHPSEFSNYGSFVDIFAPGSAILGADWRKPDGGLLLLNGTSEATPIAAGVAALHLEGYPPTALEIEHPHRVALRTRLSLIASSAQSRLSDLDDPLWASPGGNGILGGAANLLLQSCARVTGLDPAPRDWHDGVASVRLGDGITSIPTKFTNSQFVSHPDGPVELVVNLLSLSEVVVDLIPFPISNARLQIVDLYDDRVLFDSELWRDSDKASMTTQRVVVSKTSAGVRIDWSPKGLQGVELPGFGYAMTAAVVDRCTGDLNGDRVIDGLDLARVLSQWGSCLTEGPCSADLNGDGVVDGGDLTLVLSGWGACSIEPRRGMVFDCNGNEVPRAILGDKWVDAPRPEFRSVQVGLFGAITAIPVDLLCPELNWDTNGGPFVVAPDQDPRTGACKFPISFDLPCVETTASTCLDGVFLGAGIECDSPQGAYPQIYNPGPKFISLGLNGLGFGSIDIEGGNSNKRLRQQLPPGLTSLSQALVFSIPQSGAMGFGLGGFDESFEIKSQYGISLPPTPCRTTIEFSDGGPPATIDSTPTTNGIVSTPEVVFYEFGTLLEKQDREIRTIEFSPAPTGIAPTCSNKTMTFFGNQIDSQDVSTPGVEFSIDGGITWSVYRHPVTNQRMQMYMFLAP